MDRAEGTAATQRADRPGWHEDPRQDARIERLAIGPGVKEGDEERAAHGADRAGGQDGPDGAASLPGFVHVGDRGAGEVRAADRNPEEHGAGEQQRERLGCARQPADSSGRREEEVRDAKAGLASEPVHRPAEREGTGRRGDEVRRVHDADRAVVAGHLGGRHAPDDQQNGERHRRQALREREEDGVPANQAKPVTGGNRRRITGRNRRRRPFAGRNRHRQLISIIFSRTAYTTASIRECR